MDMFNMFINYGEIIFNFVENFKTLVNIFEFNILDFSKYFKKIIKQVINVIDAVVRGVEAALNEIENLLETLQNAYMSMLTGTKGVLQNSNLGTLITNLEKL